jgi:NADH:ubiquinone oxidoreductase subunit 6 (subunit J)
MLNLIVFYILAGIAVASAALLVTRRNARHSLLLLFIISLATAGIVLQLQSRILFATQLLLFAGGTMAMFFLGARSSDSDGMLRELRFSRQRWTVLLTAIAAGGEAGLIYWSMRKSPLIKALTMAGLPTRSPVPNAGAVLHGMFNTHLLAFEIVVLLLLVSAAAAATVNRKRA